MPEVGRCVQLTRVAFAVASVFAGVVLADNSARAQDAVSTLIRTIDTSAFQPPSPDPSGLGFLRGSPSLLVSDGEVNETPLFTGDNLYRVHFDGRLIRSRTTIAFSDEPSGVELARTRVGLRLFVADDSGGSRIYVAKSGKDRAFGTADDVVSSFRTDSFGSRDPEGVAFGRNALFIADGVGSRIYRIQPGPNREFDGIDDRVQSFDTESIGMSDPEGVAYNRSNGHLYIVGRPSEILLEVTNRGVLVQTIDITAAGARRPAGIAYAPSSVDRRVRSFYIADRGQDNNSNPSENDGKIYEMTVPASPPRLASR